MLSPTPLRHEDPVEDVPPALVGEQLGYVIKTVEDQRVDTTKKPQRTVFKRKIEQFAEVMKEKSADVKSATPKERAAAATRFVKTSLLNGRMLASAQSKAGRGKKNAADVLKFFMRDVESALADEELPSSKDIEALVAAFVDETT